MGYRRSLLVRWSRRDRLAVVVVALTVAFLTGATLLLLAAGAQTTAIAAGYGTTASATVHDSPAAAAAPDATVVPLAAATRANGSGVVVAGVPPGADRRYGRQGTTLDDGRNGTTLATLDAPRTERLRGSEGQVTVDVHPRNRRSTVLPPSWYVSQPSTVADLGATGALSVRQTDGTPATGVPLLGALPFFVLGTRQAVATLGAATLAGGFLIAVTIYSVTGMTVRDRIETIRVVRATGGPPAPILAVFALRAALLAAVGIAGGYAVGLIATRGAVNLAITLGFPTSLDVAVTGPAARVLLPTYAGLVAVGVLAGVVAAWPAVRRPPARLTAANGTTPGASGRLRAALAPTLLGWRAVVPTAATLTGFVVFVVLVASLAGVVAPLASADGATVTQPGSAHPIGSRVPAGYADALQGQGIDASAEILLFEVVDGQPFVARGARYDDFASVTDATLVRGEAPTGRDEAVVGADLAQTLGVEVGDRLLLGGSTRAAVTRVEVVGVFAASGLDDDQLVVSLPVARQLTTVRPGRANLVRADRLPVATDGDEDAGVGVVDVDAPEQVGAGEQFTARVTVRNDALTRRSTTVTVQWRDQVSRSRVDLASQRQRTVEATFDAGTAGTATLAAGDATQRIRVVDPDSIVLRNVPARAPPDSEPLVRVLDGTGAAASGVPVTVTAENRSWNRTVTTGGDGRARLPLGGPGTYTVVAEHGEERASSSVAVRADETRELRAELRVAPDAPTVLTTPVARLSLRNPWNETLSRSVVLAGPDSRTERNVSLDPGTGETLQLRLDQRPPGTYTVTARTTERRLATLDYRVRGDDRITSALASSGRRGTTGIGQAVATVFGNLRLVAGVLVVLAGLMTVGGTTATFAGAVHARRRTVGVHRATGASPAAIVRLVVGDALRIGIVAALLALAAGVAVLHLLAAAGYLTPFGVRLSPTPSPAVAVATVAGALALTVLGAGLATAGLLARSPAGLLAGRRETPDGGESRE